MNIKKTRTSAVSGTRWEPSLCPNMNLQDTIPLISNKKAQLKRKGATKTNSLWEVQIYRLYTRASTFLSGPNVFSNATCKYERRLIFYPHEIHHPTISVTGYPLPALLKQSNRRVTLSTQGTTHFQLTFPLCSFIWQLSCIRQKAGSKKR